MSYMNNAGFAPVSGIQELSFDEIDSIAGGPGPLAVGGAGAVVGGGIALFNELTDGKPGVNGGNVAIGAAAGAGAAITGLLGIGAGIAGGLGFGALGIQSTRVNTALSEPRVR